jgi:hypothetical protein
MSVNMKLKYYLRGVGAGILFAAVILTISYRTTAQTQLSDAEIIKRAEALGMVKQSDINMDDIITPTQAPTSEPTAEPTMEPSDTTEAAPAEEPSDTEAETTETVPPPSSMEEPSGKAEESTSSAMNESEEIPVSVEIISGMTSEDVSYMLKEKGVLEDVRAFNQYLKQNDYTTRINIGVFQIKKFDSYQNIADVIVSK